MNNALIRHFLLVTVLAALAGCSTVYYSAMEKLGYEKREILVDRVEDARDAQSDAQETFRSSLERFQSVVSMPDSELKAKYEEISDAYEDSKDAADKVRKRDRKSTRLNSSHVKISY